MHGAYPAQVRRCLPIAGLRQRRGSDQTHRGPLGRRETGTGTFHRRTHSPATGKRQAGFRRAGGLATRAIAENIRQDTAGGGYSLDPGSFAQGPAISRKWHSRAGQQLRAAENETCSYRPQELDVRRPRRWRQGHGHRLNADRNGQTQRRRSPGLAHRRPVPHRRPQDHQIGRATALALRCHGSVTCEGLGRKVGVSGRFPKVRPTSHCRDEMHCYWLHLFRVPYFSGWA